MPRARNEYDAAKRQGRLWSPPDANVSGLVANWDASDKTTLDIQSGNIANWTSRVGNLVLTQATSTARPAFSSAGWRGATVDGEFPSIDFSGAIDGSILSCASGPYGSDINVFLCCERWTTTNTGTSTTLRPLIWTGVSSGGSTRMMTCRRLSDDPFATVLAVGGSGTGNTTFTRSGWTLNKKCVVNVRLNTASAHIDIVGTAKTSSTFTGGSDDNATNFSLGGGQGSTQRRSPLRVTEVIVLSAGAPSDLEDTIEGYLAWKWGIQRSLGGAHRYANRPPLLGD